MIQGFIYGSINVLPSTSLISRCKSNLTDIYPNYNEIVDYFEWGLGNSSWDLELYTASTAPEMYGYSIKGL